MEEIDRQYIKRTLEVWQPRSLRALTAEDARQIVENATGFFGILAQWEKAEQHIASRLTKKKTDTPSHAVGRCPE
jgi:hypothetical protein